MTTVREIMTVGVVVCPDDTTSGEAARRMAAENVGALPVCDDRGQLCGMITDRDLAIRIVGAGRDPDDVTLGELLDGTEVVTIGPDDSVEEAIATMKRYAVRRLPVVEGTHVIGIVSQADIARELPDTTIGSLVDAISSALPNN